MAEPDDPIPAVQGVQSFSRLPDALGRRSCHNRPPDGGAALGAKCRPRGHLNQAAGTRRQSATILSVLSDAFAQVTSRAWDGGMLEGWAARENF